MSDKRSKLILGLFLVSAVVVLALSLYTGISLNSLVDSLEQSRNQRLLAEAQATSLIVSADELNAIQDAESLSSEQGAALERRLSAFATLHNLTEITFIRPLPTGEMQYIVGSSTGSTKLDITLAPIASNEMIAQALNGSLVVTDLHAPDSGSNLMAYSPVYDSSGNVVAVAAVGIDDGATAQADTRIRNLTIILLVCIAVVILAACANVLLQVRKEQELQESVRVQELMIQISQTLASEQPFDERVTTSLETLGTYLGAFRAYIVNTSEPNPHNALRHHWNGDDRNPEADSDNAQTLLQMMRDTFVIDQNSTHASCYVPNINQPQDKDYTSLKESDMAAFIWSPLVVQNEIWGVLALDFSKAQNQFPGKDVQLVESAVSDLVGAITRELYNEQREQALDHAIRASEAKSEFLSNMSHEMRTPMNAIVGMTSIALASYDESRKDYCLEHIKDASDHLLTIINDVLDMSSLQSDELSLKNKPFDLRKTMHSVVRDHAHSLSERNQVFTLEVDDSIPSLLIGDRQRLGKVISNLLSNAIKFTPDEGTITLRVQHLGVTSDGHSLRFEVEDNGIGVEPGIREGLFGSFAQVEKSANRKYGGTGMGLALSRRLVELMGGQIGLDSSVQEGSLFYVTVTLESDPSLEEEQSQVVPANQVSADSPIGQNVSPGDSSSEAAAQNGKSISGIMQVVGQAAYPAETGSAQQNESSDSPESPSVPDFSAYRILLAEDIEINREVVLALLDDCGIQIDITTNGIEVFEAVKENPGYYDLVFMDLQMPEMGGLDATRRIRALPNPEIASLPIIAMTANVFQEDIDACLDAGMNDHIGKPISLDEIYRILNTYLPKKD